MVHHRASLNPRNHYACNDNGRGAVLAQLQEVYSSGYGEQVRLMLTPAEARHFASLLTEAADRAEASDSDADFESGVEPVEFLRPPVVIADPDIMGGTPCLSGSRLPAAILVACADRNELQRIANAWPWVTHAHIEAARAWVAEHPTEAP